MLSILVFSLLLGGSWWYITNQNTENTNSDVLSPIKNYFPTLFENTIKTTNTLNPLDQLSNNTEEIEVDLVREISNINVLDFTIKDTLDGPEVWFVAKENGHIYRKNLIDKKEVIRVANQTTYQPQAAWFITTNDLVKVIISSLTNSTIFDINLSTSTAPIITNSTDRPFIISQLSNNKTKVLYGQKTGEGLLFYNADINLNSKNLLYRTSYRSWVIDQANQNTITFTTKASNVLNGFLYTLNIENKQFTRELGPIRGLTTKISPSGEYIIFSNSQGVLNIYNLITKSSEILPIKTLTDKCVWTRDSTTVYCGVPKTIKAAGGYPDIWYKGIGDNDDNLWVIDRQTLKASPVVEFDQGVDISNIQISSQEDTIIFKNKKNDRLWLVGLLS